MRLMSGTRTVKDERTMLPCISDAVSREDCIAVAPEDFRRAVANYSLIGNRISPFASVDRDLITTMHPPYLRPLVLPG